MVLHRAAVLLLLVAPACGLDPVAYAESWRNNTCADAIAHSPEAAVDQAFDELERGGARIRFVDTCEGWGRDLTARAHGRTVELCEGWDTTPQLAARVLWHELVHVRQRDQDTLGSDDLAHWAREVQAERQEILVRRSMGDGDEFGWRDQAATFAATVFDQYALDVDRAALGPVTETLLLEAAEPDGACEAG